MVGEANDDERLPALDVSILLLALASAWTLANREMLDVESDTTAHEDRVARHRAAWSKAATRIVRADRITR